MPPWSEFFKNKKVTILGLGLLGRGVGDAAFIAECGAMVTVTDKKTEEELNDSVGALKKYSNISFKLGGHDESDFNPPAGGPDMIIKAAGVPLESPYIAAAKKAGVPVYMSTALYAKFAREVGATIVGITGTRGKTTTTRMIFDCLVHAGKSAHLGGNIRGLSTLAQISFVKKGDISVLELDSWQLQGFGDLKLSPQVAVFTNLYPDHQNYYDSMDAYFSDKATIFASQQSSDDLICGEQIVERIRASHPPVAPVVPEALPENWQLSVPGVHNRENAALAKAALESLGLSEEEIRSGLEAFEGVEGRLQYVREVRGVQIYNDNNATTPEATIAALKALSAPRHPSTKLGTSSSGPKEDRKIVLILGGSDKGLRLEPLLYEIAQTTKRVICLTGTGTSRITPLMQDFSLYDNLEAAVKEAFASASPGDIILFSPAFASFGMFKNEYERNDEFLKIVKNLN